MCVGPIPSDRRVVATNLCQLLALRAEDESVPLEQLAHAAREISEYLLEDQPLGHRPSRRQLTVIEGGLK